MVDLRLLIASVNRAYKCSRFVLFSLLPPSSHHHHPFAFQGAGEPSVQAAAFAEEVE